MKKIISYILVLSILLSLGTSVLADAATDTQAQEPAETAGISKNQEDVLIRLGVLEEGFTDWDKEATRGFAASAVMKMLGRHVETTGQTVFVDVNEGTPYAADILTAYDLGLINVYDNGYFYPDKAINYAELSKMLVSALGYQKLADSSGGFPDGYISYATSLKILKTGNKTDAVSNKALFEMIYRAMDTPILEIGSINKSGAAFEEGDSLLSQYHDAVIIEGLVTEVYGTAIDFRTAETRNDEIKIGDYICKAELQNPLDYLGKKVKAYVKEDALDSKTVELLSFLRVEEDTAYTMYYDEFTVTKGAQEERKFVYTPEGQIRSKTINVPQSAMYYYNGRIITDIAKIDSVLNDPYEGYVHISKTAAGYFVFIYEYYNIVVSTLNKNTFVLKDAYSGDGYEYDDYAGNLNKYIRIYQDGKQINFEDIKVNSVVSVFESADETWLTMYVYTASVNGEVEGISQEGGYRIDGTDYKLAKNMEAAIENNQTSYATIKLKDSMVFVLDYLGRIADFSLIRSDYVYSYLFKANAIDEGDDPDGSTLYRFKLYNPDTGEVESFFARDKIKINGVSMKNKAEIDTFFQETHIPNAPERKLACFVKVKIGENNTVTAMETPIKRPAGTVEGDDSDRLYYVATTSESTKILSGRINGKYILNNDTNIFQVSEKYEEVEKKTYASVNDYKGRKYQLYEDDELGFVKSVVIQNDEAAGKGINEDIYYGDQMYIVMDAALGLINEDDEIGMVLRVLDNGKEVELKESDDGAKNVDSDNKDGTKFTNYGKGPFNGGVWGYGNLAISDIQKGDIIQVDYDGKGCVDRFRIIARLSDLTADSKFDICYLGSVDEPYSMMTLGRIEYMNKIGFRLNPSTPDYPNRERVYLNNTQAAVYVYNLKNRTIEVGSWSDVSKGAKVLVRAIKFGIKQIYVIEE